jgi:hypothetical protein
MASNQSKYMPVDPENRKWEPAPKIEDVDIYDPVGMFDGHYKKNSTLLHFVNIFNRNQYRFKVGKLTERLIW